MTDLAEAMGNIWKGLGQGAAEPEENGNVEELRALVNQVQAELLGTIEALQARVVLLERALAEVDTRMGENESAVQEVTNVFELISPEELLGRPLKRFSVPEDEDVEIRSVKGFTAPPPEEPEVEEVVEDEEEMELELDMDLADFSDESPITQYAMEVYEHILNEGGVLNQEMKRLELIPADISDADRKAVYEKMEELGIKKHRVNKMRIFYYLVGEGAESYKSFMKKKKDNS